MRTYILVSFWIICFGTLCRLVRIINSSAIPGQLLVEFVSGIAFGVWAGILLWGKF